MLQTLAQYERESKIKDLAPVKIEDVRPVVNGGAGVLKPGEIYYLLHPERPRNGSIDWEKTIIIKDLEFPVECSNGMIITKEPEVRDYFTGQNWILEKTISEDTL